MISSFVLIAFVQGASAIEIHRSASVPDMPVCADISCADIECIAPLELRRLDDQCCAICWAPDHVVGLDRHTSMQGSPYGKPPHPAAPTTCGGVKCFKLMCAAGHTPGHVQGDCCESCVPGL